jgi:hypothetical protein
MLCVDSTITDEACLQGKHNITNMLAGIIFMAETRWCGAAGMLEFGQP